MNGSDRCCCGCRHESSYPARVHRISAGRPPRRGLGACGAASWPGPHSGGPPGLGPSPPLSLLQRGVGRASPSRHPGLSCSWNNWVARGAVDNRVLLCRCGLWWRRGRGRPLRPSLPADPRPGGPPGPAGTHAVPPATSHRAEHAHTWQYLFCFTRNKVKIYSCELYSEEHCEHIEHYMYKHQS